MSEPSPATVESAELKPCPFCGGSAYCNNDRVCPRVHCSERTCSIYDFSVSPHSWNTRAIDAHTKELEAQLAAVTAERDIAVRTMNLEIYRETNLRLVAEHETVEAKRKLMDAGRVIEVKHDALSKATSSHTEMRAALEEILPFFDDSTESVYDEIQHKWFDDPCVLPEDKPSKEMVLALIRTVLSNTTPGQGWKSPVQVAELEKSFTSRLKIISNYWPKQYFQPCHICNSRGPEHGMHCSAAGFDISDVVKELDEYFQKRGVAEWCFGPVQSRSQDILPMEEGCDTTRKTELLHSRIQAVIDEEQFGDMTIAEIIGTLEIAKSTHINRLFQE